MSGHSKWAQIKRQKGVNDARKGQVFTKLAREISVAAREGGPDPDANFRLRLAIQRARESNMPSDNIERAIKRGTGQTDGAALEEIVYEGYGPGGAALMVEVTTDNRNRAAADVRNAFTRGGGSLGESGCVAWQFASRGIITVEANGMEPDEVALLAIDAGAEDVKTEDGTVEIYTAPTELDQVRRALEERQLVVANAERALVPTTMVTLDDDDAERVLKLMDRLEELDDVSKVYTNVDFPDHVLEQYENS